ncbi:porin [Ruegeria arenilitoris]|uniref:porin n=1 Tax=Ruegeria arenilitoris TaxID=1173585 RepID=UPI00147D6633|nr:porin [Ruegeria arenilitoris]
MKNVLLATTALIATASVAAAEVKLSGYARFGIGYAEDRSTTNDNIDDTILVSRFRLNIDANAETDAGVKFSARVRLEANEDETNGNAKKAELSGARFSVIYGGLRVDAGNVSGAIDNLADYAGNEPGLEAFISQNAGVDYKILAFDSTKAGSNAAFFQYAVGDLAFGASYDTDPDNGADRWDVSATYTFNNVTAALAYGETEAGDTAGAEDESLAVLTLGAEFGDLSGTLFLADDDVANDDRDGTAYGFSLAYNIGAATTITAAYGDGSADDDEQQYGVGFIYDLGSGASLQGGVAHSERGDEDGRILADFGARFNF